MTNENKIENTSEIETKLGEQEAEATTSEKTGKTSDKAEKTFTQSELDEIIAKRLAREKEKQAEMEAKLKKLEELEKAEEERKKAEMTLQERLQAEKEEAEKTAQEAEEKAKQALEEANKRIIETEIRAIAREFKAHDVGVILSQIDRSNIEIDENGNVKGVKEAIQALKESKSFLFKQAIGADALGGSNPSKNPTLDEITAKEKELEELKKKAVKDRRLLGRVTRLANEIYQLKSKK